MVLSALLVHVPANGSAPPCPAREPGTYPWSTDGTMPGDKWAWIFLELDKNGKPKRCLMGENNVRDDDLRFFMCRAAEKDWQPATPEEAKALASSTVKRRLIMRGPDHWKKMREARKRYFEQNPHERPECYPE